MGMFSVPRSRAFSHCWSRKEQKPVKSPFASQTSRRKRGSGGKHNVRFEVLASQGLSQICKVGFEVVMCR